MKRRRAAQEGFTLIEIMVVILIIGLLATLVVQSLRGSVDRAKRTKAMADISELRTALDRYYIDNGSYPTTEQGLQSLVDPPGGQGTGYVAHIPLDPWGHPYFYQSDGNTYTLKSFGADGVAGGKGNDADIDASQF